MIIRYITYLLKETGLRILNFIIFPVAWIFRNQARKNKGFLGGFCMMAVIMEMSIF